MDAAEAHAAQRAYWGGQGGAHWAAQQRHSDIMLAPVADAAIARAAPAPGEHVLDIGCGCGATTLAQAARVGAGHVTGIDISAPMLAVAAGRSAGIANITWLHADAATHDFAGARFDLLFSRFGVMFFGDPVAAFANLRRSARPGARIVFACWRPLDQNPWMLTALRAAQDIVPPLPRPGPEDPGPYSFADPARVTRILTSSGWQAPQMTPLDLTMDVAAGGGLEQAVAHALQIGPTARLLADQPAETVERVRGAIRSALAPHADPHGHVMLAGQAWLVESRA